MGQGEREPERVRDGSDLRRIEVTHAADGRYVVASLGGGMPVAIRMTRAEAEAAVGALSALLAGTGGERAGATREPLHVTLPVRLAPEALAEVAAVAGTCGRSREWVIARALRLYLRGEGAEVLAVRRGREEIARGESHDMDDVLAELEGRSGIPGG